MSDRNQGKSSQLSPTWTQEYAYHSVSLSDETQKCSSKEAEAVFVFWRFSSSLPTVDLSIHPQKFPFHPPRVQRAFPTSSSKVAGENFGSKLEAERNSMDLVLEDVHLRWVWKRC